MTTTRMPPAPPPALPPRRAEAMDELAAIRAEIAELRVEVARMHKTELSTGMDTGAICAWLKGGGATRAVRSGVLSALGVCLVLAVITLLALFAWIMIANQPGRESAYPGIFGGE